MGFWKKKKKKGGAPASASPSPSPPAPPEAPDEEEPGGQGEERKASPAGEARPEPAADDTLQQGDAGGGRAAAGPEDAGPESPSVSPAQELEARRLFAALAGEGDGARLSSSDLQRFGYVPGTCGLLEQLLGGEEGLDAGGFAALARGGVFSAGTGQQLLLGDRAAAVAVALGYEGAEAAAEHCREPDENVARGSGLSAADLERLLADGPEAVLRAAHGRDDVEAEMQWLREVAAESGVPVGDPALLRLVMVAGPEA